MIRKNIVDPIHATGLFLYPLKISEKTEVISPYTGKYGPVITLYLDTFHSV